MFGLGFGEIVIIAIVALLVLGEKKLPDAAKQLGKTLRDLRRATDDIKDQIQTEIYSDERKGTKPALVPPVAAAPAPSGPPPSASIENVPGLEAALAEGEPAVEAAPAAPGGGELSADAASSSGEAASPDASKTA